MQKRIADGLEWIIHHGFGRLLGKTIRYRYVTVAVALATITVMWAYYDSGRIDFSFVPKVEAERVTAEVEMPFGTPVEDTKRAQQRLLAAAHEILEANGGDRIVRVNEFPAQGREGVINAMGALRNAPTVQLEVEDSNGALRIVNYVR